MTLTEPGVHPGFVDPKLARAGSTGCAAEQSFYFLGTISHHHVHRPFYQKKRWVSLCLVLTIALASTVAYIMYKTLNVPGKQDEILMRYGSMFRTPEQQKLVEMSLRDNISPVRAKVNNTRQSCSFTCSAASNPLLSPQALGQSSEGERNSTPSVTTSSTLSSNGTDEIDEDEAVAESSTSIQYRYHGCCISHTEFFSPGRLRNRHDQWRRVIQFRDRRQYFSRDICRHAEGCRGCTCSRTMTYNTAIVVDYDGDTQGDTDDWDTEDNLGRVTEGESQVANYRLELVQMEGGCKCFNN